MARIEKTNREDIAKMREALDKAYEEAAKGDTPFLIVRQGHFYEVRSGKLKKLGKAPVRVSAPEIKSASFKVLGIAKKPLRVTTEPIPVDAKPSSKGSVDVVRSASKTRKPKA